MTSAIASFFAVLIWGALILWDPFVGILGGWLPAGACWAVIYLILEKPRSPKARRKSAEQSKWFYGVIAAIPVIVVWGAIISPYLEQRESARIQQAAKEFADNHPDEGSAASNADEGYASLVKGPLAKWNELEPNQRLDLSRQMLAHDHDAGDTTPMELFRCIDPVAKGATAERQTLAEAAALCIITLK